MSVSQHFPGEIDTDGSRNGSRVERNVETAADSNLDDLACKQGSICLSETTDHQALDDTERAVVRRRAVVVKASDTLGFGHHSLREWRAACVHMLPSDPPIAARRHYRAGADWHFWN